ncbi:hypothetical protein EC835_10555 [Providencia alcalifaciens]|uniref:Uncharacterized protein n=1 Tax=Providencia alcalifaciens TaxID=126385 RepID=A0A4R3NJF9_9GAMM|nr:hypothetical protein [Providencia alcalifaciens]TCT34344.1 hypothetical protein EC835_10555 [Providencia alcalifaciens]
MLNLNSDLIKIKTDVKNLKYKDEIYMNNQSEHQYEEYNTPEIVSCFESGQEYEMVDYGNEYINEMYSLEKLVEVISCIDTTNIVSINHNSMLDSILTRATGEVPLLING